MILQKNENGIISIRNSNTSSVREMISVNKSTVLSGIMSFRPLKKIREDDYRYTDEYKSNLIDVEKNYWFDLGYNENIIVQDRESAIKLLQLLDDLFDGR